MLITGPPYRQPALVHCMSAHCALPQFPLLQIPPGVQSPLPLHGPAQPLLAVQEVPRFDDKPWMHRLPPAWVGDVPVSVSVLPQQLAFRIEFP